MTTKFMQSHQQPKLYILQMLNGNRLAERRELMNLSQARLGKIVGLTGTMVGKLERGESLQTSHIFELSKALHTSAAYLMDETDDPSMGAMSSPTPETLADHFGLVQITAIDLKFGMGGGAIYDAPVKAEALTVSREWLSWITPSNPADLVMARGMGDSMYPTISDGDVVLIDRSQNMPYMGDQIWAIAYYGQGMIKRLRPGPEGSFKIMSDNPNVSVETAHDGEMTIIGRVVAVVRRV